MGFNKPNLSRRWLRPTAPAQPVAALPPPWTDDEILSAACTRCGACIADCPQGILIADAGGLPRIDFHRGECTFCGACADACPAPVFDRNRSAPWAVIAAIGTTCLAARGVVCQSCRDACPVTAIQFRPRPGGAFLPAIVASACTGCGACVSVCPADAIAIVEPAHAG